MPTLQLGNPWGYNNPQPIPLSQLASAFVEVDIGTFVDSNLITGGTGNDITTLSAAITNASVDLGAGGDVLTLADGTNSATVANTETIIGGTGDDFITLGTASGAISIDLVAGNDVLSLGSFTNAASVSNVETLIGGSGADTVTLGTALAAGMSVDLAGGKNKLTLAGGGNSGTVKNVATLVGGASADAVTFGGSLVGGSVDLGAGSDTLTLANFTNRVSTANVETVQGGTGNDTIVLTGAAGATVIAGGGMNFITGSSGADTFVFNQNAYGSTTWVRNFSTASGDKLALDTTGSATLGTNTFDLGGAALIVGVDLASVADVVARLATTLNNGGKGAFLYEQDTGELCYSGDGSFAAGGALIGVITTDGVTPWSFSANDLMQV